MFSQIYCMDVMCTGKNTLWEMSEYIHWSSNFGLNFLGFLRFLLGNCQNSSGNFFWFISDFWGFSWDPSDTSTEKKRQKDKNTKRQKDNQIASGRIFQYLCIQKRCMLKFHKCKCLATKKGIFAAKMQQWSVEKAPVESLYSKLIQMKICFLDLS